MIDKIIYFIMVPMVYLALAWCFAWAAVKIVGILKAPAVPPTLRIFPDGKDPEDWNTGGLPAAIWDALTMPALRTRRPLMWSFLLLFHIAIVLVILAHIDLLPQINIMPADSEHMIGNGLIGVVLTISVLYFLFRRFRSPVREISVPADYLLLFLLVCLLISGDVISWGNSWTESGFVMTKQDFGLYLESLMKFTFQDPQDLLSGGHYPVIVTHVLFANLLLLVLPFSKIMHSFFAVPLNALRRG
jgi:[DsrC]-trisulfide reductase subunit M